jgi:hypothetical protein
MGDNTIKVIDNQLFVNTEEYTEEEIDKVKFYNINNPLTRPKLWLKFAFTLFKMSNPVLTMAFCVKHPNHSRLLYNSCPGGVV